MDILFLTAEMAPLAKVGGLADVAGELTPALRRLGLEVRLAMPFHAFLRARGLAAEEVARVRVGPHNQEAVLYRTESRGVPVYLIDGDPVRATEGVYAHPTQDGHKYAFFCLAALEGVRALGWRPHLVHAHEWQTTPALLWLAARRGDDPFWGAAATLLTIHNLPYMGAGAEEALAAYGLGLADPGPLPEWARSLPLPQGLLAADWLSTVSPTYAQEIQTPEFGCGLEGVLAARSDRLVGILNGIDPEVWNPAADPALPAAFSAEDLAPRAVVKRHLQETLGLPARERTPLLGMVTRLDYQKGVDLALEALERLEDLDWQFVLLGTGDPGLEDLARRFAAARPGRAHAVLRFDGDLARQIYGGADIILVPSRYEPCGLAQMIAMRYGAVPVVRATGGLRDTVRDYDAGKGTGFLFGPADPEALAATLRRAFQVLADRRRWRPLQRRAMAQDFSWDRSARAYHDLYRRAVGDHG